MERPEWRRAESTVGSLLLGPREAVSEIWEVLDVGSNLKIEPTGLANVMCSRSERMMVSFTEMGDSWRSKFARDEVWRKLSFSPLSNTNGSVERTVGYPSLEFRLER